MPPFSTFYGLLVHFIAGLFAWTSSACIFSLVPLLCTTKIEDIMHLSMFSPRVGGGGGGLPTASFPLGRDFDS